MAGKYYNSLVKVMEPGKLYTIEELKPLISPYIKFRSYKSDISSKDQYIIAALKQLIEEGKVYKIENNNVKTLWKGHQFILELK